MSTASRKTIGKSAPSTNITLVRWMSIFPELTGLWCNRDFALLWVGRATSQFASGIGALGFVAVIVLRAFPLQVGTLSAVGVAPGLIFGLGAGVWANRMRRRPILVMTRIGRVLSLASIPATFILDVLPMEQLYVVAFFNGVGPATVVGFLLFGIGTLLLTLTRGPIVIAGAVLVIWNLFEAPDIIYGISEVSLRQGGNAGQKVGPCDCHFGHWGISAGVDLGRGAG